MRTTSKTVLRRSALAVSAALVLLAVLPACRTMCPASETRFVSCEQIAATLPDAPMVVGFDVDDTVLLSSPGFHYGQTNTDGPDGTNKYAGEDGKRRFWEDMNREFDKFSLPKQSARQLIEMHKGRGDRIVFVTARPQTPDEGLSAVLARTFGLTNPEVVFVGKAGKTDALRRLGVVLYYGDSDSDIIEAREAGCRTVRVLRPAMSTYTGAANPGTFGEDVLESSDR